MTLLCGFLNLLIFIFDFYLVVLHIWLWKKNLTTYAYIINNRKLRMNKKRLKEEEKIRASDKHTKIKVNEETKLFEDSLEIE